MRWQLNTWAGGVPDAVMTDVRRRWRSIISNLPIKTSGFLIKAIPGVGVEFERSFESANSFALTAIVKSMPSCSFPPKGGLKNRVNSGNPKQEGPVRLYGNPERSLPKGQLVGRNVQRLEVEDPIQ